MWIKKWFNKELKTSESISLENERNCKNDNRFKKNNTYWMFNDAKFM